ncbi:MAG TPA: phosphatidylinositol-specific phospholipase C1-like protein [Acidimicrobiia bacterium]|nr:phosphatidylinositol-specific phospholipase C1-like protein [Acidimicrobiia bacterium]
MASTRGVPRRFAVVALVVIVLVIGAAVAVVVADDDDGPSPAERAATCAQWTDPDASGATEPADDPERRALADGCLRLNHLQAIGSHNSYHRQPEPELFAALQSFDSALAASFEYSHSPLATQFAEEGVRQIELDVFADPAGGLYDTRVIHEVLGLPTDSGIPELEEPGFKVLHVQDVDFESTCWTFVQCLEQVKAWSDANSDHVPLAILVELKQDEIPDPLDLGFVTPHPIGAAELDALDAEIASVFPAEQVITPDDVRGDHATLDDAVTADGWPKLGESRGKVLFLMDNGDPFRSTYLDGHPVLEGRMLFTSAEPGDADAAFIKRNDPTGENEEQIRDLVRRGYVVRTRADADTVQARTGDTSMRDAALASGAQWVSTDYPVEGRAAPFGSDYVARLPGPGPVRCNPVITGPACRDDAIE